MTSDGGARQVGVGVNGKRSALARVTLVSYEGDVIYDQHVRPPERVTGAWGSGHSIRNHRHAFQLRHIITRRSLVGWGEGHYVSF
jgi:hypothetical protein